MKTILTTLLLLTATAYGAEMPIPLDYDERVVTITILAEARGEGKAGMYAVACVIRKRMDEKKLPAVGVCLQSSLVKGRRIHQFSCWGKSNKELFKLLNSSKEHLYAMDLAVAVIHGGLKLEYVKHANHYCTLKTHNYWTKGQKPVKIIGNHKFFKLD